jgi:hypothetical protein
MTITWIFSLLGSDNGDIRDTHIVATSRQVAHETRCHPTTHSDNMEPECPNEQRRDIQDNPSSFTGI